jgi:hypothetical protein
MIIEKLDHLSFPLAGPGWTAALARNRTRTAVDDAPAKGHVAHPHGDTLDA